MGDSLVCVLMPSDGCEPGTGLQEATQSFLIWAEDICPDDPSGRSGVVGIPENSRGPLWEYRGKGKQGRK